MAIINGTVTLYDVKRASRAILAERPDGRNEWCEYMNEVEAPSCFVGHLMYKCGKFDPDWIMDAAIEGKQVHERVNNFVSLGFTPEAVNWMAHVQLWADSIADSALFDHPLWSECVEAVERGDLMGDERPARTVSSIDEGEEHS